MIEKDLDLLLRTAVIKQKIENEFVEMRQVPNEILRCYSNINMMIGRIREKERMRRLLQ